MHSNFAASAENIWMHSEGECTTKGADDQSYKLPIDRLWRP